jgi:superfamily II DNA or RNA helicase
VKFRSAQEKLTFSDLATFWSEAENADFRLIFTNALDVSEVANRRKGHLLISREQLELLDEGFWDAFKTFRETAVVKPIAKKLPRSHQQRAVRAIVSGFESSSRGKLIAACGIGKTLIGLWSVETLDAKRVLFMAPNLQLIRQTLDEWARQASEPFEYLVVCSDQTVNSGLDEISDAVAGSDIPVTTDANEVRAFLHKNSKSRKILFSTYQSLQVVASSFSSQDLEEFDFGVFDEAHKTAGVDSEVSFGVGLTDANIPISRRLFLTATERLYSPRLVAAAAESSRVVFSMDNKEIYGETFFRMTFSQAIQEKIISDYRVVLALVSNDELLQKISTNYWVVDTSSRERNTAISTEMVINEIVLKKVFAETGAKKLVSYHRSVRDAKWFADAVNNDGVFENTGLAGFSIDGSMPSSKRSKIIREFEQADSAVLTNARCLVEGVDIPLIDGVFFASPKNSLIDIVQAIGRALRQPYGSDSGKVAAVVVPILLDSEDGQVDVSSSNFDRLYNVIQALRDQDEGLADIVDQLNLHVARKGSARTGQLDKLIRMLVPTDLNVVELEEALTLRIAEVNGETTGAVVPASHLGAGERHSGRARNLRTIGDYTPLKYKESLVDPTLSRFADSHQVLSRADIKINNNNVGHAEKLGVITESESGFQVTPLGSRYLGGEISFDNLFANQILKYRDQSNSDAAAYPYRFFLEFMLQVDKISYHDFLYGIYSIDTKAVIDEALADSVERVKAIRDLGYNATVANSKNKTQLLEEFKSVTGLAMNPNDVWTDRTTTFNQFRSFRRHLELFSGTFIDKANVFQFDDAGRDTVQKLLDSSAKHLIESDFETSYWLGDVKS